MMFMLLGMENPCIKSIKCESFRVKKEYEIFYNKRTDKNS